MRQHFRRAALSLRFLSGPGFLKENSHRICQSIPLTISFPLNDRSPGLYT